MTPGRIDNDLSDRFPVAPPHRHGRGQTGQASHQRQRGTVRSEQPHGTDFISQSVLDRPRAVRVHSAHCYLRVQRASSSFICDKILASRCCGQLFAEVLMGADTTDARSVSILGAKPDWTAEWNPVHTLRQSRVPTHFDRSKSPGLDTGVGWRSTVPRPAADGACRADTASRRQERSCHTAPERRPEMRARSRATTAPPAGRDAAVAS